MKRITEMNQDHHMQHVPVSDMFRLDVTSRYNDLDLKFHQTDISW